VADLPPSSTLPLGTGVTVVARNPAGLVALAKPGGVRAHPNGPGADPRALLTVEYDAKRECYQWTDAHGAARELHLLHRLDGPTSGVILLATTAELAAAVRAAFAARTVEKTYLAAVFGAGERTQGTWTDRLEVGRQGGHLRTRNLAPAAGSEPAVTRVRCLRPARGPLRISLLSLRPKTGRTHQLRVQCASRHLPIVGDATYGDFTRNRALIRSLGHRDLFLHAASVALRIPFQGRDLQFSATAPTPPAFDLVCPPG